MENQLTLDLLPVTAPGVQARYDREAHLERVLEMIRAAEEREPILDHCPEHTTMNIAIDLHGASATAIEIRGTAAALHELRRRGALVGEREWCPYFDQWTTSWMIPARPRPPAKRPRRVGILPLRLDGILEWYS